MSHGHTTPPPCMAEFTKISLKGLLAVCSRLGQACEPADPSKTLQGPAFCTMHLVAPVPSSLKNAL